MGWTPEIFKCAQGLGSIMLNILTSVLQGLLLYSTIQAASVPQKIL